MLDILQLAKVIVSDPPTSYDSAGLLPLSIEVIALHEQNAALRERVAKMERVREEAERCDNAKHHSDSCREAMGYSNCSCGHEFLRAALDDAKEPQ